MDGYYGLPSGHVEKGERPITAALREGAEELNITLKEEDLKLIHVMARGPKDETGERIDLFYQVKNWKGEPVNNEPHKCDDLSWFALHSLPQKTIPYIKYVLDNFENTLYSEVDW
jgi:ADP-ribose pyrophosphatase YjhB (NUDIX family)